MKKGSKATGKGGEKPDKKEKDFGKKVKRISSYTFRGGKSGKSFELERRNQKRRR